MMSIRQGPPLENDRAAGISDRMTEISSEKATLRAALQGLSLDGAIFFRAEYTEAWAYESPSPADLAAILEVGRGRITLFHIVAAGACEIVLDSGESLTATAGEVIVIPYGNRHVMRGETPADSVPPIASLMDEPPWHELPVLRHGGGGDRTDVVCGYLDCEDPLFDPGLAALPPVFAVRPTGAASAWVEASIQYALDGSSGSTTSRLAALLLTEILETHLATAPAADEGWLAALRDPLLAPVLAAVHRQPQRHWTVSDLAELAAVSRSTLDQRFRDLLDRPPMGYVRDWRMHVAKELLGRGDITVNAVARAVGYEAVEAFSRAFRRTHGRSPADWRGGRLRNPSDSASS